jgi:sugar phosphate isomerase/epimerase
MKIGVMVESFRAGLKGGLEAAAEMKADGVQIYATSGEMHPSALIGRRRAELREQISALRLEISALCADFGGHGFEVAADNRKRVEDSKRVMDLAVELGCRVVTTHIGVLPADRSEHRYGVMAKAMEQLGTFAESVGAVFAIETGPEPSGVLRAFLDDLAVPRGLGANLDPANLAMVIGEDSVSAVRNLAPYTVHTHAKDGIQLKPVDPLTLYHSFAGDAFPGFDWREYIREVPLGEGQVNFDRYLPALRAAGYDGYLTIEREVGENPTEDIRKAVKFLRQRIYNQRHK